MKWFKKVVKWVKKQFKSAEKVMARIEPYIPAASKVVADISAAITEEVKVAGPNKVLGEALTLLTKAGVGLKDIQSFVTTNKAAPIGSVLLNLATALLKNHVGGSSALVSDLNLAVQLAYSVAKG
ncbi:MAG: hypothetical protein ACREHG_06315 [Candidatus Saccharimonadales bacterium]